jgi:hypothetical protein
MPAADTGGERADVPFGATDTVDIGGIRVGEVERASRSRSPGDADRGHGHRRGTSSIW